MLVRIEFVHPLFGQKTFNSVEFKRPLLNKGWKTTLILYKRYELFLTCHNREYKVSFIHLKLDNYHLFFANHNHPNLNFYGTKR